VIFLQPPIAASLANMKIPLQNTSTERRGTHTRLVREKPRRD
jgi:hypothetical protein